MKTSYSHSFCLQPRRLPGLASHRGTRGKFVHAGVAAHARSVHQPVYCFIVPGQRPHAGKRRYRDLYLADANGVAASDVVTVLGGSSAYAMAGGIKRRWGLSGAWRLILIKSVGTITAGRVPMIRRALLSLALLVGLACAEDYSILMSPGRRLCCASELGSFSSSRPISSTSDTIRADATILLSGRLLTSLYSPSVSEGRVIKIVRLSLRRACMVHGAINDASA